MVDTDLAALLNEREEASLAVCEDLWWQQRQQARDTPNLSVFLGDSAEKRLSWRADGALPIFRMN